MEDKSSARHKPKPRSSYAARLLPYLIPLFAAMALFAYYWFEYLPSRTTYFLSLRFRTLALISRQVKIKAENLFKLSNKLKSKSQPMKGD